MRKFIVMLTAGLLLTGALNAGVRTFSMKNYKLMLDNSGTITVYSRDYKILQSTLMNFNVRKPRFKRIWPPRRNFQPEIKISKVADTEKIVISYKKPGLIKSFRKEITLYADRFAINIEVITDKAIDNSSANIGLFPEVFNGAAYRSSAGGQSVTGVMPKGAPDKSHYILYNLDKLADITFSTAHAGKIEFSFTPSQVGLSDYRFFKWSRKYNFHFVKNSVAAGKNITWSAIVKFPVAEGDGKLQSVPLTDKQLYIRGAKYVRRTPLAIVPSRFSREVLAVPQKQLNFNQLVAAMTSGITLDFATDAKDITVKMSIMPYRRRGLSTFRIYRDGKFLRDVQFERLKTANPFAVHLQSDGKKVYRYRIDLPTNSTVTVTGVKISKGASLCPVRFPKRPAYLALGDSITHGSVALDGLAAKGYPVILAEKLNFELYNLAVGGSKVSPPIGDMLKNWHNVALITLLIGFNDYSWGGVSVKKYRASYLKLLKAIRKYHPKTPLFCITMTYTKLKKSKKTGVKVEEYRQAVIDIIKSLQQAGDKDIFLIHGEQLTSEQDLHDTVHFNVKGNRNFAEKLYKKIAQIIVFDR